METDHHNRVAIDGLPMLAFALLFSVGCSSSPYDVVPVSGTVTLDGQPLGKARVSFEPIRKGQEINAGPGSYATSDEQGRFVLETLDGDSGAIVGQHRVTISTSASPADRTTDEITESVPEVVPIHYLDGRSPLEFEVPSDGTDQANFELKSVLK